MDVSVPLDDGIRLKHGEVRHSRRERLRGDNEPELGIVNEYPVGVQLAFQR